MLCSSQMHSTGALVACAQWRHREVNPGNDGSGPSTLLPPSLWVPGVCHKWIFTGQISSAPSGDAAVNKRALKLVNIQSVPLCVYVCVCVWGGDCLTNLPALDRTVCEAWVLYSYSSQWLHLCFPISSECWCWLVHPLLSKSFWPLKWWIT